MGWNSLCLGYSGTAIGRAGPSIGRRRHRGSAESQGASANLQPPAAYSALQVQGRASHVRIVLLAKVDATPGLQYRRWRGSSGWVRARRALVGRLARFGAEDGALAGVATS